MSNENIKKQNLRQLKAVQDNFKFLRIAKDWSIKELAEISGISEKILIGIENGEDFEIVYLWNLCDIYNIEPWKVFYPLYE